MKKDTSYHLIGIGGIGMSGIARLLLRKGIPVSGSDLKSTGITRELEGLGARIFLGHRPENVSGVTTIVYSSAIKEENPEMQQGKLMGLPFLKRAEALAMLMEDKTVITVSGSHGKTTTASLASYLLLEAGLEPCVAVGGIIKNIDSNSCLGGGRFFVAEADESDGSFLCYRPTYSIITNIDREHLDYYKEFDRELDAFKAFLNKTEKGGCVFCCGDDPYLKKILKDYKNRVVLFGMTKASEIHPENISFSGLSSEFDCIFRSTRVDRFTLALGGRHNISNALSVIALGLTLGIEVKFIRLALRNYKGADRRLDTKYKDSRYWIIDDYAHHPTEIRATLEAVKSLGRKRVIAIFQPHRYSRTKLLLDEFGSCFDLADKVILTDIYAAGETPLPGADSGSLYDKIKEHAPDKDVFLLPKEQIAGHILELIEPDDLVITLGAGDIVKVSELLSENLKKGAA